MFLMSVKSVCKWLVMTELELFINIIGIFAFTIILCWKCDFIDAALRSYSLKVNSNTALITWEHVFAPLFIADCFQAYFCCIVFVRQFIEYQRKAAIMRLSIAALLLLCRILFKYFVVALITSSSPPKHQVVFMPLFIHLGLVLFRSCELKKHQTLN
jgi:hypothetical protein